jgi:hypothetical protein
MSAVLDVDDRAAEASRLDALIKAMGVKNKRATKSCVSNSQERLLSVTCAAQDTSRPFQGPFS